MISGAHTRTAMLFVNHSSSVAVSMVGPSISSIITYALSSLRRMSCTMQTTKTKSVITWQMVP